MSRRTSVYEELRRTKHDLKRLRSAIPRLMRPEELLDHIVTKCRDVMLYSSIVDKLHHDVPFFSTSSERWGELERDAQILELKAENCEIRFLYLRHSLRTLFATAPLLIATGKTSEAAWETMLEQPQMYYDAEGRGHELPMQQETIEKIIADQLMSINDLHTTLRNIRSTILCEERAHQESNLEKVAASINTVHNAIEELKRKVDSQPMNNSCCEAEVDDPARRGDDQMDTSQAVEEIPAHDRDTLNFLRRTLEAKIHVLEIRIGVLEKELPCRPRAFVNGLDRSSEKRMRCVFCGARGSHYSDSCGKVRDGKRRKLLLRKEKRCITCLELECMENESCPKFWTRCFHCGQMGHHSAVCDQPDVAKRIEEQIEEATAELRHTKEKVDAIRRKLGMETAESESLPNPTL
ncbi:hypothetical protein Y032_0371g141 [Ancylostoma ceylanicum]|uniref:CCHC-type domain-containing protein n=1 Tax=Ancylostoma ceylanicum TaxID=53326 RepID=A0A016RV08_9BILA|nr:hypothetical protein Y032_0371g141 [Ancylostoma ceylanicum]